MSPGFDVVVVGAGATGVPLAARLSEDPGCRVLLLEAGPDLPLPPGLRDDIANPASLAGATPGHPLNWNFTAALTDTLTYPVPRGKVIGGSTSINGTYFVRAHPRDFDSWAARGLSEWSYDRVLPAFIRSESDRDYPDHAMHGAHGPVPVTRYGADDPLTGAFLRACAELGYPSEPDKNAGAPPGHGLIPCNALAGTRIGTALAYLAPIRERPNLRIRTDTFVRRVLFSGTRATGVEFEHGGTTTSISAGEVIVSAGAFNSPHLLMLSGVGPAHQLRRHGIDVVADLPGVGEGFSDHPDLAVPFRPEIRLHRRAARRYLTAGLALNADSGHGDLEILLTTKPFAEILAGSTPVLLRALQSFARPRRLRSGLRGVSWRRIRAEAARRNDLAFLVGLQQPTSRGEIRLQSADPHVQPAIAYHHLSAVADRRRMRQVIRVAAELARTDSFAELGATIGEPGPGVLDDDSALDRWAAARLGTAIHACGSCKMGLPDDPEAVVDQHGRVYQVNRLRVADTSIFPVVPSRGPAATAVMAGEHLATLIAAETAPQL